MKSCVCRYDNSRKKQQRKINKAVRLLNKNTENDSLWKGRFFVRQAPKYTHFEMFEDKSGGEMMIPLRFYDKKTFQYVEYWGSCEYWSGQVFNDLSATMNHFIIEDVKAWDGEDPRKNVINFVSISNDEVVNKSTPIYDYPLISVS